MKIKVVREEVEVAVIVLECVVVAAIVLVSDAIEARWIGHREGAQQNALNQSKDRGVRADAEGQGEYCREGEAGRVAQLSQGIADVLRQHLKKRQSALGPVRLCDLRDSAEVAERHSPRLLFGHAAFLIFFNREIDVGAE